MSEPEKAKAAVLTLTRNFERDGGTFGTLVGLGLELATVELAWRDNRSKVSCIPPGRYELRPRRFNRGGYEAAEVRDVPGRTHILIHVGNWPQDVLGCICPGLSQGPLRRAGAPAATWAVYSSRVAFGRLMEALRAEWAEDRETWIEIIGVGEEPAEETAR